jgi:ATP-binding cassette subfamily C (CFTR/MRP) protein 4
MHATNTATGILTIRACQNQQILRHEYEVHSDYHTQAWFALISVSTWFAVVLDMVVAIYTLLVVFGCILLRDTIKLEPGAVGILLVYIIQIMSVCQWCVQLTGHVENLMTSAERVTEYTELPQENLKNGKLSPLPEWPQHGEVLFENVSFAYSENLDYVLKDVTFKLEGGEKIGIVGRTGAGKSTIFQTLFRMAEPDGTVLVDGVDIKDISLHLMRSKISIIPQEPTLFIGPLRYNLDPFGKHQDKVLWETLEIVRLFFEKKNCM